MSQSIAAHDVNHCSTFGLPLQLLLLDNHFSHISVQTLKTARENNVHILAIPSKTSHITQPLDRCVFSSLQQHYQELCSAARAIKTGHTLSLSDFPPIVREALLNAATPVNITASFRNTGVWPIDQSKLPTSITAPASKCKYLFDEGRPSTAERFGQICFPTLPVLWELPPAGV